MKKILLIPSLITIASTPLVALVGCNDNHQEQEHHVIFEFASKIYEKEHTTDVDQAYYYGNAILTSKDVQIEIDEYKTKPINTRDPSGEPEDMEFKKMKFTPTENPLVLQFELEIDDEHLSFDPGITTFDLELVWYENAKYDEPHTLVIKNFIVHFILTPTTII